MRVSSSNGALTAALIAAVVSLSPADASVSYRSSADMAAAENAASAVRDRCGPFEGSVDRSSTRGWLEHGMGTENYALRILKRADNMDDVSSTLWQDGSFSEVLLVWDKILGLALFAMMLLIFPLCAPTGLPCGRRCRCWEKERSSGRCFKACTSAAVLFVCAGFGVCGFFGRMAYLSLAEGFDNWSCASAKILDASLSGQEDLQFVGLLQTAREFGTLADQLEPESNFSRSIRRTLNDTEEVSKAVYLAAETLQLLSEMMDENLLPVDESSTSLLHTCVFCKAVGAALPAIQEALSSGAAKALADVREEVDRQLGGEVASAELQLALRDSAAPIEDLKDLLRDSVAPFVDSEKHELWETLLHTYALGVLLTLSIACALLALCGLSEQIAFVLGEHGRRKAPPVSSFGYSEDIATSDFRNPYGRCIHRASCCTWMCSWCLAFPLLLLGGVLMVVAVPLSGSCLLLEDVNGELLRDIAPALEIDMSGNRGTMLVNVVEECFNPAQTQSDASLLDILFTIENGTVKPLRQRLVQELEGKLSERLANLSVALEGSSDGLATSASVTFLRTLLGSNSPGDLILPDAAAMKEADTDFAGVPDSWLGFSTSASCESVDPIGIEGAPLTVAGIRDFCQSQEDANISVGFLPCNVSGPELVGSALPCPRGTTESVCKAGNALLLVKEKLLESRTFRCDLFEAPGGTGGPCDVADMLWSGSEWVGDCMSPEGSLTRRQRSCSLEEFVEYARSFDSRIRLVLERVDAAAEQVLNQVNVTLRGLVNTTVVAPINEIASGAECDVFADYYREAVDSLCHQSAVGVQVIGIVSVAGGILLAILIFLTYVLWRRAIDNVNTKALEIERAKSGEIVI